MRLQCWLKLGGLMMQAPVHSQASEHHNVSAKLAELLLRARARARKMRYRSWHRLNMGGNSVEFLLDLSHLAPLAEIRSLRCRSRYSSQVLPRAGSQVLPSAGSQVLPSKGGLILQASVYSWTSERQNPHIRLQYPVLRT